MREKVEAQEGVSDPATGVLGTRGVRVLGWAAVSGRLLPKS